jgi:hypothetical protein
MAEARKAAAAPVQHLVVGQGCLPPHLVRAGGASAERERPIQADAVTGESFVAEVLAQHER